jgi:large subunit ribosomal protein L17
MPKPVKGYRLGAGPSHQRLILSGLAAALLTNERIRTTETKAKRLRPVAERLITLGKSGSVHARRQALALIEDRDVVHKLFAEIAPRYVARHGGYTRILKLGPRKGDAAPMALIELVEGAVSGTEKEKTGKRRGLRRRRRAESSETEAAKPGKAAPKRRRKPDSAAVEGGEAAAGSEAES